MRHGDRYWYSYYDAYYYYYYYAVTYTIQIHAVTTCHMPNATFDLLNTKHTIRTTEYGLMNTTH